jgi:CRISPR-associated protein Cas5t
MRIKALQIQIYQPTTHFRIPFTYQRRHTYPLPPYSTAIGMLINILGLYNQEDSMFRKLKTLKLSISGTFETKTTEYIWFRNLSKSSHVKAFGTEKNRIKNSEVNHPGGQSPIKIDVLDNFHCNIHITQENNGTDFLNELKNELENPVNRLEVIHLGRAEDWIVIKGKPKIVELEVKKRDANYKHFFWIPEKQFALNEHAFTFNEYEGLYYSLPTFATIENYNETFNRHGKRNFETIRVKLNDGLIKDTSFYYDAELKLPVFLADFNINQ